MSAQNIYDYIQGEFTAVDRLLQEPAGGLGEVRIYDENNVNLLGYGLSIWDSPVDGVQLIEGTDYQLIFVDSAITQSEGVLVYAGYEILNPAYGNVPLYLSGNIVGGYTTRPYRPTYTATDASITVDPSSLDDSVIADTTGGDITVTLPDGERVNQRVTVIADGTGSVIIDATGPVSGLEYSGMGTSFVWADSGWLVLGGAGAGGGSGAGMSPGECDVWPLLDGLPAGKLECNGALYDPADFPALFREIGTTWGGDGVTTFAVPTITPEEAGTIWGIHAFDTVQEVPSDPALVRDWVNKWANPDPQTNIVTTLPNTWGEGLFLFGISYVYGGGEVRSNASLGILQDGLNRSFLVTTDQGGTGSSLYLNYIGATNTWEIVEDGSAFTSLSIFSVNKWEAVTGEDIVLNPPVDGWETVWEDTPAASVVNSWGAGFYRLLVDDSTNLSSVTLELNTLNESVYSPTLAVGTGQYVFYDHTANQFSTTVGRVIVKIDKFNSLINLVHSYHPDPRSVAQKDWVKVYEDYTNTSDVTNVWGDGFYSMVLRRSDNASRATATGIIANNSGTITGSAAFGDAGSSGALVRLTTGGVFETYASSGTWYIAEINRWQDSQASDAPRTVLDEGWELAYENLSNTAWVDMSGLGDKGGTGWYYVEISAGTTSSGEFKSALMHISDIDQHNTSCLLTAGAEYVITYNPGSQPQRFGVDNLIGWWVKRIWKFTGLLRISANYNLTSLSDGPNQVKSINTDSSDVDAGVPASPVLGDLFEVWNTGTNGNHVTGLPDGITLGDGKGIRLRYVDGWKYEDCIVDEYNAPATATNTTTCTVYVTKWAGGLMRQRYNFADNGTNTAVKVITPIEPFVVQGEAVSGTAHGTTTAIRSIMNRPDVNQYSGHCITDTNAPTSAPFDITFEGRWK